MPSASAKVDKSIDSTMDPFKQSLKFVEHKIRNLEKRKAKLDVYKKDQQDGKELNADQLAAVAKFTEVVQQLDFSRDFLKQLTQLNDENDKALKKQQRQQKAEQNERLVEQQKNYENLLIFQGILKKMAQGEGREMLMDSAFSYPLTEDDLKSLTEFKNLVDPGSPSNADFLTVAAGAGERYSQLFEGSSKVAVNGRTYREIRTMLIAIRKSNYLSSLLSIEKENSAKEIQTQTSPVKKEIVVPPKPLPAMHGVQPPRPPSPKNILLGSGYNFLQDSRIDNSPHMDPAVVAVSSVAVAPLMPQRIPNYDSASAYPYENKYEDSSARNNLRVSKRANTNHTAKSKKKTEKIEEWNPDMPQEWAPAKTTEDAGANAKKWMKPEGGEWPYANPNEQQPEVKEGWAYAAKESVTKPEMEEWAPKESPVAIPTVNKSANEIDDWVCPKEKIGDTNNGMEEWNRPKDTTVGVVNGMNEWSNVTPSPTANEDNAAFQGPNPPAKEEAHNEEDWVTPPSPPTNDEWGSTFNSKTRPEEENNGNQWNQMTQSAPNGGTNMSMAGSFQKRRNKASSRSRARGTHNGYGRDQGREPNRDYNRDQNRDYNRDYSRGDFNRGEGANNFVRDQNLSSRPPRDSGYSNGRGGGNFHGQDQRFEQEPIEVGEYKRGGGNFRGFRGTASIPGEHAYSRGGGDFRPPRGGYRRNHPPQSMMY